MEIKIYECWQIFIGNDSSLEPFSTYQNKSYSIPLFQRRQLISRIDREDFRNEQNLLAFNYRIRSSNERVVKIEKETNVTNFLIDDFFIVQQDSNVFRRIFKTQSMLSLIELNQTVLKNTSIETKWVIEGFNMNLTQFKVDLILFYDDNDQNRTSKTLTRSLNILVTKPERLIDLLFYIIVPVVVIIISIFMGVLIDPNVITKIVKEPKALLIGLLAQYGLMPFLAAAIAKLFHYDPLYSLALFVIGCCPGSGASNQWTILFDGDVNLSAMMSFVSTASSFLLMPLYFYTLGRLYMDELKINVPFIALTRSLTTVAIPYSLGIGISHWFPKVRPIVQRLIKPMMICMVTFFVTFGFTVNWYVFKLSDIYTGFTAPLLPTFGYIFGGIFAWMSRLSWKQIKTVAIEAGMQNTGIAFMIVMYSFPQPHSTQAVFIPMVVALLTPIPLCFLLILRNLIVKCRKTEEIQRSPLADGKLIIGNESTKNDEQTEQRQQL